MPNWCANNLMVTGDLSELERFRDAITTEEGGLDILARLVPVPASSSAAEYWGSKWGDCDTDSSGVDEFGFSLWFSSAWSPPVDGIAKVSGLFPSLLFVLEFEEGGEDFCGAAACCSGFSRVAEFSISEDTTGIDWDLDYDAQNWDLVSDAVNDLKARAAVAALVMLGGQNLKASKPIEIDRDAARWNAARVAIISAVPCASCENAGEPVRLVDPYIAAVVPWDVMGDPRAFAFVCDECALGSAVVL